MTDFSKDFNLDFRQENMELIEMRKYVEQEIHKQGSASAKVLAPLFTAIIDKLSSTDTGDNSIATIAVTIGEPTKTGDNLASNSYKVTNEQEDIDQIIDTANQNHDLTHVAVLDNNLAIIFNFLEYSSDELTAMAPVHDGEYYLHLSKDANGSYMNWTRTSTMVAPVTEAEIEVYKKLFGATYDYENNKFQLQIGTSLINLTPADMLLADQEYDKVANTTNYTAMWANSKAKYIKCHDWFQGFQSDIDMHSAFYGSDAEIIGLNAPNEEHELNVSNCTQMFAGCIHLQQIDGIIVLPDTGYSVLHMFGSCNKLITFKLKNLAQDLDLSDCNQVSPESILYLVQNAKDNIAFVITLEASVLEKYNSSADWAEVRSAVEANSKIVIA